MSSLKFMLMSNRLLADKQIETSRGKFIVKELINDTTNILKEINPSIEEIDLFLVNTALNISNRKYDYIPTRVLFG